MTHPLRIGYIVPQFPGQTHIFFWREIKALEAMGHEVQVLSTRKPPRGLIAHDWSNKAITRTQYLGRIELGKAMVALARLLPRGLVPALLREGTGFAKDTVVVLSAALRLLRLTREMGLTHVHAHSCGRTALIAAYARMMGGAPYSLTLHGPLSDYGPGQRVKWQGAEFATVITRKLEAELRDALPGHLPDRLLIRPMGVDTDVLRRDTPYAPPEHGRPIRLFSCARLNEVKGHQDLMAAVRRLLDQGVDVRLEIAGEDDAGGSGFRTVLESRLKELHLRDHVTLLGAIDADAVKAKLLQTHIFVLASWHEPLGVAYMEAMACGVPVIGTDAGGVPELITDGDTGMLVPPKSPDQLADAVRKLATDPDKLRRLGIAGRAHVEAHFRASLGAETLAEEIQRGMTAPA